MTDLEFNDKVSEKEEELKTKTENCRKFAQAARNWKTRFEEKNTKLQEIEKNFNESSRKIPHRGRMAVSSAGTLLQFSKLYSCLN